MQFFHIHIFYSHLLFAARNNSEDGLLHYQGKLTCDETLSVQQQE